MRKAKKPVRGRDDEDMHKTPYARKPVEVCGEGRPSRKRLFQKLVLIPFGDLNLNDILAAG